MPSVVIGTGKRVGWMNKKHLELVEYVLDFEPGELNGAEVLEDIGWDSVTVMSFVAIVKKKVGVDLNPADVVRCESVSDLITLIHV